MSRTIAVFFVAAFVFVNLTARCHAADIVWVNEDRGGGGGDGGIGAGALEWEEDQWRELMEGAGHNVIAHGDPYFIDIDFEQDRLDLLNSSDLVIVSRDANSGEYDDSEEEIQAWTEGITAPMLILTPYHTRSSRWRMFDSTSIVDVFDNLEAVVPDHPVFNGVTLDAGNSVQIWDDGLLGPDDNIDVITAFDLGDSGELIAREVDTDNVWIAYWPAGVEFYDGSDTIAGGPRMTFFAGSDDDPNSWGEKNITAAGDQIFLNAINFLTGGGGPTGDFNGNGELDAGDLDALSQGQKDNDPAFDLNGDGMTDVEDRKFWLNELRNSWIGDSNLDGEFSSSDFVVSFQAGKYETGQMATWTEGDWDGNMLFDSSDFVLAFQEGGYEMGPRDMQGANVPEPSCLVLGLIGIAVATIYRRKRIPGSPIR